MASESIPSSFDVQSRAKIRAALKAYMKAHRIGVPTLWDRVLEADPKKREVSMPSMQRLIRGTHHSSEMLMEMCLHFLETQGTALPADPDDPLAEFRAQFEAFFVPDDDEGLEERIWTGLAGRYHIDPSGIPPVVISLETADGVNAVKLTEQHIIMAPDVVTRYEGVLVRRARQLFGLLRNSLTYEPRVYWLQKVPRTFEDEKDFTLVGHVQEQPFRMPSAAAEAQLLQEVRFAKSETKS